MTRINLVNPYYLTDEHLRAEYRELPRIFTAVHKAISQGKTPHDFDIPEEFVLGKGHNIFFYDKITWLVNRYKRIVAEMMDRGHNINQVMVSSIVADSHNIGFVWRGDYDPSPQDIYLSMARLVKRSNIQTVLEELSNE